MFTRITFTITNSLQIIQLNTVNIVKKGQICIAPRNIIGVTVFHNLTNIILIQKFIYTDSFPLFLHNIII